MSDRAGVAWNVFVIATEDMPELRRAALRKLVRAFGDARFEQGRARESQIQVERDTDRLREEFERRRGVRA